MSRRTLIGLLVPLVLIASYYGVMSYLRAHVSDLIAYSVDKPLPEFQLVDRDGKQWSNKDLVGKCAVLHFFRSSNCLHIAWEFSPMIREGFTCSIIR